MGLSALTVVWRDALQWSATLRPPAVDRRRKTGAKKGAQQMDSGFIEMAERIATDFSELPDRVVIRTLTSVHDEYPDADAFFIEEAVRARLALIRQARLHMPRPESVR